jgi:CubicO group peptidase (beta-lactamase class C family)
MKVHKKKLNDNTVFELASCTKPFTAMAILILKDRGKLNLDDKISKYIPELYKYNNITIRNLLNHTGGLPDYMALMNKTWDKSKIATNKDVIKTLEKHQPKELFKPNTKEEYSNTGYVLLASIIEKTSGKTYAEFLDSAIFKPLKMTRTFVYHRRLSGKKIKNYAFGYLYMNDKYILPDDYSRSKFVFWLDGVEGDGTVNSTTNDLYKWVKALNNNKLVSKESLKLINSNGILNDGTLAHHGYGWRVLETEPFGKIARHSGGWPGYLTYIERDLDNDKTVIMLQNHYNGTMPKQAVRNILYGMPIPKTMEKLYSEGKTVDEIIDWLKNPVSKYLIDDFYEDSVNKFGYDLLTQDKNKDALKIFEYNTVANPKSSNAFDSFGECLLKMDYKQQAKKAYEKSLELDPTNKNAESIISKLKGEH